MKIFLYIISILIILASGTLGALAIWNIYPESLTLIWKTSLSLLITSITLTLFWLAVTAYINSNNGNKAYKIN